MAYNNENQLRRIIDVQEVYLKHHRDGVSDIFIYRNYIKPVFHISVRTFRTYLATNAKFQLKQLLNENNDNDQQ